MLQAKGGQEALRVVQDQREAVALVVSDVIMPGMGGPELGKRLTAVRASLPVLLISAYSRDELSIRGIVNPDVQVLPKPFDIEDLARRIRVLLNGASDMASGESRPR